MRKKRTFVNAVVAGAVALSLSGCVLVSGNTGRRIYSHNENTRAYTHSYGATYTQYKSKSKPRHKGIECFHGSCKS